MYTPMVPQVSTFNGVACAFARFNFSERICGLQVDNDRRYTPVILVDIEMVRTD